MKTKFITSLIILLPFLGFSQDEWNNWYFGAKAGVSFNSGIPQYLMDGQMTTERSVATVSDSLGNLLFYTDGTRVYDRTGSIMPNGSDLLSREQDQAVYVVRNITDDSLYYIFTLNCPGWPPPLPDEGLHYSVVDMRLNGGLGDVAAGQKNISLLGNANFPIEMTATRHHNNKDAWLIIHNSLSNNNFYAYLITSGGIQQPPVVTSSTIHDNPVDNGGFMRVSHDGTKLISPANDGFEYCQFNSSTGQITHLFDVEPTDTGMDEGWAYIEFSVDSRYLYRSSADWQNAKIYQYDATLEDSVLFKQSETYVGLTKYGVHLQMGPDWKIYGDESYNDSLCVINNPETVGLGCNFQANAVYLNHRGCLYGLPQFLQKYYAYINHSTIHCPLNPVNFTSSVWPPADSIKWNFGDTASGSLNFSTLANPVHIYSNAGTFTVELYVRHIDLRTDTTWQTITIAASPNVNLGPNRSICIGDSTTFDAGACNGCTYQWKNLGTGLIVGTGQTYTTGLADSYSATVTNSSNCTGSDTVQLFTTPVPSVTNNPLSESICSGESTNIALTSSVPGTNFYWTASLTSGNITGFSADSGLIINQILTDLLTTPGIVTYHITPKAGNCSGPTADFQVTINPLDSVKVSITSSNNNICSGTQVTFTADPTNPGSTPVYQWKVNGINSGTNSTTFNYTPVNNDIITCILLSSLTGCILNNPATSNGITMVVNPVLPVSVSVAASQNPVCSGTSVIFTATATNGGSSPQ
ncbi:MAG: PKD domain-containing protein, partial [Bacteroidales bacterium]